MAAFEAGGLKAVVGLPNRVSRYLTAGVDTQGKIMNIL